MKEFSNLNARPVVQLTAVTRLNYGSVVRLLFVLAVAGSITIGLAIRLEFVLHSDFPLNDGGLFYNMVLDLQRSGYALPAFTTYNADNIPFAYPPLALYLAALVHGITHASLVDVFRFFPLATNILTIVALAFFARTVLSSRTATVWAVFTFALLPRSYEWMIMGGGLTRSLGFLFAVLALHQAYQLYTQRDWRYLPLAATFAGLTVLSHIEMAWFLAVSIALLALAYGRYLDGIRYSLVLGCGAILVSAPWWVAVVMQHGIAPFLASAETGGTLLDGLMAVMRLEPINQILAVVSVLGIVVCLGRSQLLLPVWLLAIFVLDSRSGATTATIPLALLAGIGVSEVIMPFFGNINEVSLGPSTASRVTRVASGIIQRLPQINLIPIALILLAWQLYVANSSGQAELLSSLTPEDREEMRWVRENTPPSSRFLVISGASWATDRWSEWFPVLADRTSVATVQGYEWLEGFAIRQTNYAVLQSCASSGDACLDSWAISTTAPFTHLFIPKQGSSWRLINALLDDRHYTTIHNGPGAIIFRRVAGP